jgi:hypothetical protein
MDLVEAMAVAPTTRATSTRQGAKGVVRARTRSRN